MILLLYSEYGTMILVVFCGPETSPGSARCGASASKRRRGDGSHASRLAAKAFLCTPKEPIG